MSGKPRLNEYKKLKQLAKGNVSAYIRKALFRRAGGTGCFHSVRTLESGLNSGKSGSPLVCPHSPPEQPHKTSSHQNNNKGEVEG